MLLGRQVLCKQIRRVLRAQDLAKLEDLGAHLVWNPEISGGKMSDLPAAFAATDADCGGRVGVDTDTDDIEAMFDEYGFDVETFEHMEVAEDEA